MHAFGLWEEARVPGENSHRGREHANSTQKGISWIVDLNSGPSCCEVTVLKTAPLCHP